MASVFFRPIETDAETAERAVKAAWCLHNYVLRNNTNIAPTETEEHFELSVHFQTQVQLI